MSWNTATLRRQLNTQINWREAVRAHRREMGMTREEYANWLDVGVMSVKRWELGWFKPTRVSRSLLRAKGVV
jgi:DNA-binding transcriptional regulator YiaG